MPSAYATRQRPINSYAAFGGPPRQLGMRDVSTDMRMGGIPQIGQFHPGPYIGGGVGIAPQNEAMLAGVNRLHDHNEALAQRGPVGGYQTGPFTSAAGQYAAGLQHAQDYHYGDGAFQGGLMTNYGASGGMQNLDRTYMPRVTVGGRFGLGPHAPPGPDNPYGYHPQPQMRPGWMDMMAQSQFGGATPGIFQGHQAWLGGPEADHLGQTPWLKGDYRSLRLQDSSSPVGPQANGGFNNLMPIDPTTPQGQAMAAASAMFNSRRGGPDARRAAYDARTTADMATRRGLAAQRGIEKGESRRRNMGIVGNEDFFGMNIPGYAQQQLQNQNSQGWMQAQMAMAHAKMQAEQQQQHFGNLAALAGHVGSMQGLPPGLQQSYMDQIMSGFGLHGGQASGASGTPQQRASYLMSPQQRGQLASLKTQKEKEDFLNSMGVMDPLARQSLLGVTPSRTEPPPGWFDTTAQGALSMATGGHAPVFNQHPDNFTPWQRWFMGVPDMTHTNVTAQHRRQQLERRAKQATGSR